MSDTPDLRALHEAATTLRDRYVANRGSKHEFVVTMTDQGELRHQWQNLTNALDASGHPIPRERPLPEVVEEALAEVEGWYDDYEDRCPLVGQAATLRDHIATQAHDLAVARETARVLAEMHASRSHEPGADEHRYEVAGLLTAATTEARSRLDTREERGHE